MALQCMYIIGQTLDQMKYLSELIFILLRKFLHTTGAAEPLQRWCGKIEKQWRPPWLGAKENYVLYIL